MTTVSSPERSTRRKEPLDLPSLERECMRALWPLREATVREVQLALAERRPRAYTTVMTILDRLAQKGVVTRRKTGRAWLYAPNVSAEQARSFAVGQLLENFFDGSESSLQDYLAAPESAHVARISVSARNSVTPPRTEAIISPPRILDETLL